METTHEPRTLQEAIKFFADPDNCINFLAAQRWKDGVVCPTCGSKDVSFLKSRRLWQCKTRHSKAQFSIKVGTIFEDSAVPLDKWLVAMWMIASCKTGVSSWEIHRALGVTQKTAWFMLHRIRLALQDEKGSKMSGEIEADETYIGGLARNMHSVGRNRLFRDGRIDTKTIVAGLLGRHGEDKPASNVRLKVLKTASKTTLDQNVMENVGPGSTLYTDEHRGYQSLREFYQHEFIQHAEKYAESTPMEQSTQTVWKISGAC